MTGLVQLADPGRRSAARLLLRGRVEVGAAAPVSGGVLVEGDSIVWAGAGRCPVRADREVVLADDELIAPGMIDLQVNGFAGHDCADGPEAIAEISRLLPRHGVTGFLPTLISHPLDDAVEFVGDVAAAPAPGARVLGAHLEGPFLNPRFSGAHERDRMIEPTAANVDRVLARPPRMLTIAPELPGSMDATCRLAAAGVLVSAGHTGASYEETVRAIEAGVRFGTHLFNRMLPVHHRQPGVVAALLADPRVTIGLLGDRLHVHPVLAELIVRLKGTERVALTTDQVAAAAMPPGRYRLGGRDVVSDGVSVRLPDGTLAGSVATMDELVVNAAVMPGFSVGDALRMAASTPARTLGEHALGTIAAGAAADLVVLDARLGVRMTMVAGRVVYAREAA